MQNKSKESHIQGKCKKEETQDTGQNKRKKGGKVVGGVLKESERA